MFLDTNCNIIKKVLIVNMVITSLKLYTHTLPLHHLTSKGHAKVNQLNQNELANIYKKSFSATSHTQAPPIPVIGYKRHVF